MSILPLLGCAGIGLVWGWLVGLLRLGPRTVTLASLASLVVVGRVFVSFGWRGSVVLLAAALLALSTRAIWHRSLERGLKQ